MKLATDWTYAGTAGEYAVWTLADEGLYQVTDGGVPSNKAGYGSLDSILKLKGLSLSGFREGKLVLTVLVHPGSACGSADMNLGKIDGQMLRLAITHDMVTLKGPLFVIDGFLSDELPSYPSYSAAIDEALALAKSRGFPAARVLGCDSARFNQVAAARKLIDDYGVDPSKVTVRLTGAWFDSVADSGCINSVYEVFAEAGFSVDVMDSAAVLDSEPLDDGDEDEAEFVAAPAV